MKKILLIICLLFLCSCKKNVSLNKDTFDYGAKVDIKNITDKKYKCQSKVLNTLNLGKHNDTIVCNKKEYKIKYEVIDKEKPIIWIGNTITRTPGYKEDISKELTCMDNADRTPLTNITGSYDINTVGTYNLTFTCTDNSGNSSSKDFKLVVKEKNVTTGGTYTGVLTNYLDFKDVYTVTTEIEPTTVLGCWVINHNFKGYPSGGKIIIDGSFDVNIWYSFDNDTKTNVISKTITYSDTTSVKSKENELTGDTEVIVRSLKQPTCSKVEIKNGDIEFTIEKELGIEIIGDTKAKILVEEDEDPWEIIGEDTGINEQIDKEVNENYINEIK